MSEGVAISAHMHARQLYFSTTNVSALWANVFLTKGDTSAPLLNSYLMTLTRIISE